MAIDKVEAARLADLVQFAYNMYKVGGSMPAPDPGIDKAGYKLTFWLTAQDLNETAFYGFIAQSKTDPGVHVLSIRGTQNAAEWLLDFSALPVFFHADASVGSVALGFQSIQQSFNFLDGTGVQSSFADVIGRIVFAAPVKSFTILGHSLGSALATLAAAELAVRNPLGIKSAIRVLTFASPRVGLLDFADWYKNHVPNSMRIWNVLDTVPQTPTFPFIHVEPSFAIVQTHEQLAALSKTPACEHHIANYQWLLDPANYKLSSECSAAEDEDVTTAMRTSGAQKLSNARAANAG